MKKLFLLLLTGCLGILPTLAQSYDELCELAIAATENDSLPQAEEYIRQALKKDPGNARNALLFSNLGTIQRRQHKYEQALESYGYALNFAPLSVPLLLNRATLYMELGREEQARIDYSLVLDKAPDNEEALLMRAYIYMNQRNYPFARADYQHLLQVNPEHYSGRLGLAMLEQRDNKPENALNILNTMLSQYKDDALLYIARADIEIDLLQPELALMDLEEAIRLDASQPDAYLMRGRLLLTQKKKEQARRDFEQAMKLGVPHAEVRELLQQCR